VPAYPGCPGKKAVKRTWWWLRTNHKGLEHNVTSWTAGVDGSFNLDYTAQCWMKEG